MNGSVRVCSAAPSNGQKPAPSGRSSEHCGQTRGTAPSVSDRDRSSEGAEKTGYPESHFEQGHHDECTRERASRPPLADIPQIAAGRNRSEHLNTEEPEQERHHGPEGVEAKYSAQIPVKE